jgi:regulator of sigma E protease
MELDGRPIALWARLLRDAEDRGRAPQTLTFRRADQIITRTYVLRPSRVDTGDPRDERLMVFDPDGESHLATLAHFSPTETDDPVPTPSPVLYALDRSFETTWELVEVTVYSVIRLFEGRVSVRSAIGGPIRIYEATEVAARQGAYLSLMALISLNLGMINLLPIPMLDGGHLMFLFFEAVARRPVRTRVREIASTIGLVLLVLLMVLAFTNDMERQWPRIVEAFEGDDEVEAP